VEEELAAGAGVVLVWAAISVAPANNNMVNDEVIRVFIRVLLLAFFQSFEGVLLSAALTPLDAAPSPQVHEKTFLNPFV
jgi:hypothetical protein